MRNDIKPLLPRLWRFAMSLTGNRENAQDLVQTTFVRALERADKFELGTHLDRWLMVMMRRIWLNDLRKIAVQKRHGFLADHLVQTFVDGVDVAERTIYLSQVLNQLYALPEAQREAMVLVYGEEMSYQEAADILEIPQGTLMSRLARARVSLKKAMLENNAADTAPVKHLAAVSKGQARLKKT